MAKCAWCNQDMAKDTTIDCTGNKEILFPDGTVLNSVPFDAMDSERCGDCNVTKGNSHHPGCDQEDCPRCGGQLITCGCLDVDEDELEQEA